MVYIANEKGKRYEVSVLQSFTVTFHFLTRSHIVTHTEEVLTKLFLLIIYEDDTRESRTSKRYAESDRTTALPYGRTIN